MTRARWALLSVVTVIAIVAAGVLGWTLAGAGSRSGTPDAAPTSETTDPGVTTDPDGTPSPGPRTADELGAAFLADWVDSDGRVVRRDQGDDTVSEGQAYGMLIAVGVEDEDAFDSIWTWTKQNLQRTDGLLAWQWDGKVIDMEPASDADLDAARALVLAGQKFDRPDLTEEGNTHAALVMDRMTVQTAAGRILLPGVWAAATEPFAYNPSYASPAAFEQLGASTGDPRWAELNAGSSAVTAAILAATDLPPDWAQVHADGRVEAMPGPQGTGTDVRYSYDAARLPIRYAESCSPADVALAGDLAATLDRNRVLHAELDLGGGSLDDSVHPVAYGARAASLAAAGDIAGAKSDLSEAVAVLDQTPTYYGAAWAALAPMMLETEDLGTCPVIQAA